MVAPLKETDIEIVGETVILHAGGQAFHTQSQHLAGGDRRVFPDIAVGNAVVVDPGIRSRRNGEVVLGKILRVNIRQIPIGDAQKVLSVQPVFKIGVFSHDGFPVQGLAVFQFLHSRIAFFNSGFLLCCG